MLVVAKPDQLKALSRTPLLPCVFTINQLVIFVAPIVYTPYLILLFIFTPMLNITLTYFAITGTLINTIIIEISWIFPIGIGSFLGTSVDFRSILLAFLNLVVLLII